MDSHEARHLAESFGEDAARYDRARPSYPDALVQRIVAACPELHVLDVGIGTGIAARQFQAADCRILGVEVDSRMADLARPASRWRSRRSRNGTRRGDCSTSSSPGRPGTGSIRRRERPRRLRCSVLVVSWPSSGTCSSLRRIWRMPSRRSIDERSPTRRSAAGPRVAWRRTPRSSRRRLTALERRADSRHRSSGGSSGYGPTAGTSGWTSSRPQVATASSHRGSWTSCWPASARDRRRRGELHHALHDRRHRLGARWPRLKRSRPPRDDRSVPYL